MMTETTKAERFFSLHVPGSPVVLYNIWDAGGAKVLADAGAKAVASGSWSVASAHGFQDGEAIPLDLLEQIVRQIVATVELPVTVDFEGAYAAGPEQVGANTARLMRAGVAGINFEDQIVGGDGIYGIDEQCRRIGAIRRQSDALGAPFFINARTDLFLKASAPAQHRALMQDAKDRAIAYRDAGASGIFAPGLIDEASIADLCAASPLPVNIMVQAGAPSNNRLAQLGVARISYGPVPYIALMKQLQEAARIAFSS
jgi:2-methylisocitrate lyase-like PEP mutase family enzyme